MNKIKFLILMISIFIYASMNSFCAITLTNNTTTIYTGTNIFQGVNIYTNMAVLVFSTNAPIDGLAITNVNAQKLTGFNTDYFSTTNDINSNNSNLNIISNNVELNKVNIQTISNDLDLVKGRIITNNEQNVSLNFLSASGTNALTGDQFVTLDQYLSLSQLLSGQTYYGCTNIHPVFTNFLQFRPDPPSGWSQAYALGTAPTITNAVGCRLTTNTFTRIPKGRYSHTVFMSKNNTQPINYYSKLVAIDSISGVTNFLNAIYTYAAIDSAANIIQPYFSYSDVLADYVPTNSFYLGILRYAIREGTAVTLTIYGGDGHATSLTTPNLNVIAGVTSVIFTNSMMSDSHIILPTLYLGTSNPTASDIGAATLEQVTNIITSPSVGILTNGYTPSANLKNNLIINGTGSYVSNSSAGDISFTVYNSNGGVNSRSQLRTDSGVATILMSANSVGFGGSGNIGLSDGTALYTGTNTTGGLSISARSSVGSVRLYAGGKSTPGVTVESNNVVNIYSNVIVGGSITLGGEERTNWMAASDIGAITNGQGSINFGDLTITNTTPTITLANTGTNEVSTLSRSLSSRTLTLKNYVATPAGSAIGLSMTGGNGNYFTAPSAQYFSTAGSVSMWVKFNSVAAGQTLFTFNSSATDYVFANWGASGELDFYGYSGGTNNWDAYIGGLSDLASWHHVVFTWNNAANSVKFFYDNSAAGTRTKVATISTFTNSAQIYFGSLSTGNTDFNGYIDEVAVWNRQLSDTEVSTIYNSGVGLYGNIANSPYTNALQVAYHLDENTGTSLTDYSTSNRTGTITGNPTWGNGYVLAPASSQLGTLLSYEDGTGAGEKGIAKLGDASSRTLIQGLTTRVNVGGVEKLSISSNVLISLPTTITSNTTINGKTGINLASGNGPLYPLDVNLTNTQFAALGGVLSVNGNYSGILLGYKDWTNTNLFNKVGIAYERTGANAIGKLHFLNNAAADSTSATLTDSKMSIDSSGNVNIVSNLIVTGNIGIGAASTIYPIMLKATNPAVGFWVRESGFEDIAGKIVAGATSGDWSNGYVKVQTHGNNTSTFTDDFIIKGGKIGIGIALPTTRLEIKSAGNGTDVVCRIDNPNAVGGAEAQLGFSVDNLAFDWGRIGVNRIGSGNTSAMRFYVNDNSYATNPIIDVITLQPDRVVVHSAVPAIPPTPVRGGIYYNTASNSFFKCADGATWVAF